MKSTGWLSSGLLLIMSCPVALADVHDTFGVGSASIGMGNAQVASVKGGAAAYYNPAALGKSRSIQLDGGIQIFIPRFNDLEGIVYDRNQDGVVGVDAEGNPETTTVGAQYAPSMGMGLNAALPITSWVTFGVSTYIPTQYLMRLQFADLYVPYYVMYKNRPQVFSAYMGLGVKVFDGLYLGLGSSLSTRIAVNGRITSNSTVLTGQTDPETGEALPTEITADANLDDLSISLRGAAAPTVGVLMNFGWLADPLAGLNFGAVLRSASKLNTQAEIQTNAYGTIYVSDDRIYSGPLTSEPIATKSELSNSVNPASIVAGLSYTWKERLTVSADATLTQWSDYQETFISLGSRVEVEGTAVVDVQVGRDTTYRRSDDLDPGMVWRDTVTPRIGFEYTAGMPRGKELGFQYSVRAGYGYYVSPVPEQTWRVNMLDANKHMLSAGLGFYLPIARLANPLRFDMFVSYHQLQKRLHSKETDLVLVNGGYPVGYPASGSLQTGGSLLGFGGSVGASF